MVSVQTKSYTKFTETKTRLYHKIPGDGTLSLAGMETRIKDPKYENLIYVSQYKVVGERDALVSHLSQVIPNDGDTKEQILKILDNSYSKQNFIDPDIYKKFKDELNETKTVKPIQKKKSDYKFSDLKNISVWLDETGKSKKLKHPNHLQLKKELDCHLSNLKPNEVLDVSNSIGDAIVINVVHMNDVKGYFSHPKQPIYSSSQDVLDVISVSVIFKNTAKKSVFGKTLDSSIQVEKRKKSNKTEPKMKENSENEEVSRFKAP